MNTPIDPDLAVTLRQLKLGRILDTLPERLALAKTHKLSHAEFLQIILSDEVTRRDSASAVLRARSAGLDPTMTLDAWDPTSSAVYDQRLWDELNRWAAQELRSVNGQIEFLLRRAVTERLGRAPDEGTSRRKPR